MAADVVDVLWSNYTKDHQNKDMDCAYLVGYEVPHQQDPMTFVVHIRIHHDTSYPTMQSWAKAEVWNPDMLCWDEVATYLPGCWADDTQPLDDTTSGAGAASDELLRRCDTILEGSVR